MSRPLLCALVIVCSLFAADSAQASTGALNVLVTGNESYEDALAPLIAAQPGVATAATFDTSTATPTAELLSSKDLVVSLGDFTYFDSALWGDRLADYADAGGAILQIGYDTSDTVGGQGPVPRGRFASQGYPPLSLGPPANLAVTLGMILEPANPLVAGLDPGGMPSDSNTTTPLAPGATLLATWSDGRNAIAFKNRVAATGAAADEAFELPALARLASNAGNYLGRHNLTVNKSGKGTGTVAGSPSISCGSNCGRLLPFGTAVSLTATPGPNSRFAGWSGACSGTGACQFSIAGSEVTVGAAFEPANFASNTSIRISLASTRISAAGKLKALVKNRNGFLVTGTLSGQSAGKVSAAKRRAVAKLKSKPIRVAANATQTVSLRLPVKLKRTRVRTGKLKLVLTASVKDPAGNSRAVRKTVAPKLKRKSRGH